jgi:hypothetical protein
VRDSVTYETVVMETVRAAISKQLSGMALASLKLDSSWLFERDLFNVRAMWDTMADVPKVVAYPVVDREPSSWFQMLKRQHFPNWAVRRWPIRTKSHKRTVIFELQKLYPDAPAPADYGRPIFHFAHPVEVYRATQGAA